jgi:type IV secretory pathway TraG/TraD family ATPase VirD4
MGNLRAKFRRKSVKGLVFGKLRGQFIFSSAKTEGHCAVFGGSGSGKTSALLIPTLRAWPDGTALVVNIGGDIGLALKAYNKVTLAPEMQGSAKYDALYAIDNAKCNDEKNERLMQLSFALIPTKATTDDTSAFYQAESRKMLQAALIAYYYAGLDFVDICKQILGSSAEFLIMDVAASEIELAAALVAGFQGGNEKTLAATKQEVDKAIILFASNSKVAAVLGRGADSINPSTLEIKSLFLDIPDEKLEIYSPLLNLISSQVLNYLSARQHKNPPILICLDEFASLGKMEILPALRKLRKRGVRIIILTQSLADLDLIYGIPERRAMLDNFTFKVVMAASEFDTQTYFSNLGGEFDVFYEDRPPVSYKNLKPEDFGGLDKHLVLFHPKGTLILKKNFYYKKWIF